MVHMSQTMIRCDQDTETLTIGHNKVRNEQSDRYVHARQVQVAWATDHGGYRLG
jgi:hypothetical protein